MRKILWIKGGNTGIYVGGNPFSQFIKGIIKFPIDFIRGKRCGYPTCCVLYYCILQMTELPAAAVTNYLFKIEENKKGYARCPACLEPLKNK